MFHGYKPCPVGILSLICIQLQNHINNIINKISLHIYVLSDHQYRQDLHSKQASCGLPSNPGGHLQIALWFTTVHIALVPQLHGSLQSPPMQAKVVGQSGSDLHPSSTSGSTGLHPEYPSPIVPGGHSHTIVLTGRVSRTRHLAR
jgi:hypothetical protein